ncbi:hypothetical protein ABOM_002431 [Aspergillus bombycis]|uniref:NACHT-NTPase and P-loop NTPases N-terminal domain-containing protein n=1 Tax=Aspergillus bombycis TaxID=109264 RepID=A0A1F8AAR9_9EURO|nr:hypothetical protein ABOM_002431 [Aspergillus bombycis]OGM48499.1 hypothetical protein ABOM_002431 [Aspergillus bombycis]
MSDSDISRQITGLIEVTEGIAEAYNPIKDLRGLPKAFREVNNLLPFVRQILRDAKGPTKKPMSANEVKALKTAMCRCAEKADKLLEIFKKMAKTDGQYSSSVYRAIVLKQGKHRVETLMDGILQDLGALVGNHIFPVEIQRQVQPLEDARAELAKVPPSLVDSDLAEQLGTANQYGDNGRQYNVFGEGAQRIADGHYFEAQGNQTFGMIPPLASISSSGITSA